MDLSLTQRIDTISSFEALRREQHREFLDQEHNKYMDKCYNENATVYLKYETSYKLA